MSVLVGRLSNGPADAGSIPLYQPLLHPSVRRQNGYFDRVQGGILISIVLLAPIPMASNHPLAWLLWAILIGIISTIQTVRTDLAIIPKNLSGRIALGLGCAFILFSGLQALPVFAGPSWPIVIYSSAPSASFLGAIRTISYLLFFLLLVHISQKQNLTKRLALVLFLGIAGHALAAMSALKLFGDTSLLIEKSAYFGVATGGFGNRNAFAMFLGMGVVLGLAQCGRFGSQKGNFTSRLLPLIAMWLALAIILTALIATQSRMGIAATACACLLALPTASPNRAKHLLAIAGLGIVLTAYFGQGLGERFSDLQTAFSTRMALYAQVWKMIGARPFSGHGLDSFPIAFEQFHAAPVTAGLVWDKAHSVYLTLWAEMGLIIGSIPIVLGILAAAVLRKKTRFIGENYHLASAALAALVLVGLHSVFDFGLEIEANMFLFLALIAMGTGTIDKTKGSSP